MRRSRSKDSRRQQDVGKQRRGKTKEQDPHHKRQKQQIRQKASGVEHIVVPKLQRQRGKLQKGRQKQGLQRCRFSVQRAAERGKGAADHEHTGKGQLKGCLKQNIRTGQNSKEKGKSQG